MKFVKTFLPVIFALAMLGENLSAQTFTVLHAFTALSGPLGTNADGANPVGFLLSGNTLYETTASGGANGSGAVLSLDTNGDVVSEVYPFTGKSDGLSPNCLLLSGDTLYGTAAGGTNGTGTIFSVNRDGSNFTLLHTFASLTSTNSLGTQTNADGDLDPQNICTLALSGNTLYGTATSGGTNGYGTIFSLGTNGAAFSVLHTFAPLENGDVGQINFDGAYPQSSLLLISNIFYGVAGFGGTNGNGTIYSINPDGTSFTVLHSFCASTYDIWSAAFTNSDGATPICTLVASGNILYGAAYSAGTNGNGTVFQINADGTGFTVLHTFAAGIGFIPFETNWDGTGPHYLLLADNTLFGSTLSGGINGNGTVFSIGTNGTDFTLLHTFNGSTDGSDPCSLVLSANTLYGAASAQGPNNNGTIFSLAILPIITNLGFTGTNLVINAASDVTGGTFTLLTGTNLASPLNQWTPVATNVAGGGCSFTITNAVNPGTPYQFYILQKQ